jgi:hypothetical protein
VSAGPERRVGRARRGRQDVPRRAEIKVKLSEAERVELRRRASDLGVSVPRLLVESALGDRAETATEHRREVAELFEVRRLLATVANNVNQLARVANTSGEVGAERKLDAAVEEVHEVIIGLRRLTGVRR